MERLQEQLCVLNTNFTQKVRELREAENKRVTMEKKIKDLEFEITEKQNKDTANQSTVDACSRD